MQEKDTRAHPAPQGERAKSRPFTLKFLVHLFHGHVRDRKKERQTKPRPRLSGVHHEGAGMYVQVIAANCSKPDRRGVYHACVSVRRGDLIARKNTLMFPREWSRQQVLNAIREVYEQRPLGHSGPTWEGWIAGGMRIMLRLARDGSIVTAWPVKGRSMTPSRYRSLLLRLRERLAQARADAPHSTIATSGDACWQPAILLNCSEKGGAL